MSDLMTDGSAPSGATVLVIEDEASVQAFVRMALERNGYSVRCVRTAAEALQVLEANSFGGVISDMRTPGDVDGADVFDWIHENQPLLAEHMLFITGDTVNEETARSLQRTGVPYLEKPFRISQLLEKVKQVIGEPK